MPTENTSSESSVIHDCVAGFTFCECPSHEHIALIEKKRPSFHAGLLNGIGGHIESGETPLQAMIREFHEETSVIIDSWDLFAFLTVGQWRVHMFRAFSNRIENVQTMTDERVVLITRERLSQLPCVPNLAWLIPMALNPGVILAQVTEKEKY